MSYDFDMIVIGGGSAGLTAAGMSALLGAKTALIEHHRLGGDCTWTGCVPSKTLLHAARAAHTIRTARQIGIHAGPPEIDFVEVMNHVRRLRAEVYEQADAPPHFERMGVEVISAGAVFTGPHTVELKANGGVRSVSSRYFVIATGSRPRDPKLSVPCLNNETLFELTSRPPRLLTMGGGPVGIEMSQAFARLGSEVTVVAPDNEILPRDDRQLASMLRQSLTAEGISFRLGCRVSKVDRQSDSSFRATLDNGETVACDAVLASIGRAANIEDLGLDKAGVTTHRAGVVVNARCRSSQKHIYAAGDVIGKYQFTHMAEHMGKVAVTNAILHVPQKLDEGRVTWCTFTSPELAQLGPTERQLSERGVQHRVYEFPYSKLDRAITESERVGCIKVLATASGRILGASILGENAGEMIAEYAVAMRGALKLDKVSATIHPYPTYALGNRRAADLRMIQQLDSPLLGLLGRLFGYRGERRGSAAL